MVFEMGIVNCFVMDSFLKNTELSLKTFANNVTAKKGNNAVLFKKC